MLVRVGLTEPSRGSGAFGAGSPLLSTSLERLVSAVQRRRECIALPDESNIATQIPRWLLQRGCEVVPERIVRRFAGRYRSISNALK